MYEMNKMKIKNSNKNRKGNLLPEETLKIVLAVISIGFLVFLLVSLYFSYTRNKELEQAEASLEHLIEQINAGSEEVEIYNPKSSKTEKWGIVAWPNDGIDASMLTIIIEANSFQEDYIPFSCYNNGWEECICICKPTLGGSGLAYKDFADFCGEKGVCLESKKEIVLEKGFIEITPPLILKMDYTDKITITEREET